MGSRLKWLGLLLGFWMAIALVLPAPALALVESLELPTTQRTSIQPYIDRAMDAITEFTLDNGMTFIVMERHQAPVVSFMTYVSVGGVDEEDGKTGTAHYLEHLAFKGTTRIGTTDYEAEKEWLDTLDQLFDQMQSAAAAGNNDELQALQAQFNEAQAQTGAYVIQNQYAQIVDQAGGVGLNATTSADETRYFYSFPSNKLELWMSVESERFLEPVFREFYEEKAVILEERRMRVDNSPVGTMIEQLLGTAFQSHPYRRPIIGYEDDLANLTREDVRQFFETHYTPDRITCAVVGDVDSAEVKRLAEVYFGRFTVRSPAPPTLADEPAQEEPLEVTLQLPSQPWYFEAYHMPGVQDPDHLVYQMIDSILLGGRTSRLYQSLVQDKQVAMSAQSFSDFPGNRFSNLMVLYGLTAPGHSVDEVAEAIAIELERLRTEPVAEDELERVKTQWRASLLRTLDSNRGMASLLPSFEAKTGSWRNLFEDLKTIDSITTDDVLRVAQTTFRPENRTVGKILPQS